MPVQPVNQRVDAFISHKFDADKVSDVYSHWLAFTDYLEECGIANEDQVKKFRLTLVGVPRQWYEENKESFTSLDVLHNAFSARFGKLIPRTEYLTQFMSISLKQHEDLSAYLNRVSMLASQAKITDKELIMLRFIDGLPAHVRGAVKAKRDSDLQGCMLTAQALLAEIKPSVIPTVMPMQAHSSIDKEMLNKMLLMQIGETNDKVANREQQNSRAYSSRPRERSGNMPHRRDERSASRSQSRGRYRGESSGRRPDRSLSRERHYPNRGDSRDRSRFSRAKSPRPAVSFENDKKVCTFCAKPGHLWRDCFRMKAVMDSEQPFRSGSSQ